MTANKRLRTRVAAHVHCDSVLARAFTNHTYQSHIQGLTADTIPLAMRPGLTLREALLNSSEFLGENGVYRA